MAIGGGGDLIKLVGNGSSKGNMKDVNKHHRASKLFLLRDKQCTRTTTKGTYGVVSRTRGPDLRVVRPPRQRLER